MMEEEKQAMLAALPEDAVFATVAQVYEDGVTLLFGTQTVPSQKHYRCNNFAVFHPGDRVFLAKDSGTYVALFPVGTPKSTFRADSAATADTATTATNANTASTADTATTADRADRLTTTRIISLTGDVTASGSFNGTANLSLSATGAKSDTVKDQAAPSSRTIQFRVTSFGKLQFKSSYYGSTTWYNMDGTQG